MSALLGPCAPEGATVSPLFLGDAWRMHCGMLSCHRFGAAMDLVVSKDDLGNDGCFPFYFELQTAFSNQATWSSSRHLTQCIHFTSQSHTHVLNRRLPRLSRVNRVYCRHAVGILCEQRCIDQHKQHQCISSNTELEHLTYGTSVAAYLGGSTMVREAQSELGGKT